MRKEMTMMIIVLAVASIFAIAVNAWQKAGGQSNPKTAGQKEKDEQVKLVRKGLGGPNQKKLTVAAAEIAGDIYVRREIGLPVLSPSAFNFQNYLNGMVASADAIVIGTVKSEAAQLTEDETFILTDYEIAVDEVVKDNVASHIQQGGNIICTRTGGTIQLNGKTIVADDRAFKPLSKGRRYLLFLTYVPENNSYVSHNSKASFLLDEGKLFNLTEEQVPNELKSGNDVESFLKKIRLAVEVSSIRTHEGANQ